MARPFDGSPFSAPRPEPFAFGARADSAATATISFVRKLAASSSFKAMFKEGMTLVEEAASYLDGSGRDESKRLRRAVAMAYASESMRLTTRLMQLASWLLLQRAVNEGELTFDQARAEKMKVKLAPYQPPHEDSLAALPKKLLQLLAHSRRLHAQVPPLAH